jgi:hypothetical protein
MNELWNKRHALRILSVLAVLFFGITGIALAQQGTIACTHGEPNFIGNATTTAEIDALRARCAPPIIPPETAEEKQAKRNYRRALDEYRHNLYMQGYSTALTHKEAAAVCVADRVARDVAAGIPANRYAHNQWCWAHSSLWNDDYESPNWEIDDKVVEWTKNEIAAGRKTADGTARTTALLIYYNRECSPIKRDVLTIAQSGARAVSEYLFNKNMNQWRRIGRDQACAYANKYGFAEYRTN